MSEHAIVGPECVISILYTLKDDQGALIESNREEAPLQYLHGQGQIIPGLESALVGKTMGEMVRLSVPPEEGYGLHDAGKVFKVPRSRFDFQPEAGSIVQAQGPDGEAIPLQVKAVDENEVTLDGNHPLAGMTLNFDVEVVGIRAATPEELEHGHAH